MTPIDRRTFLMRALALGAAAPLAGCNYEDPAHPDLADRFLHMMSAWNDRVQAALFNPHTLAPTFRPDQITRPPRFNAYYSISDVVVVDPATWRLELGGQIR
ncbi:MAG TPA: molybdopterin-binding protein, partial [Acidocella sp.]|nr:molybdopterin-binding protein [Acidocella sp.]